MIICKSIRLVLIQFACRTIVMQTARGHGYLSQPASVYTDLTTKNSPVAIVDANAIYPGIKWNDSPENNSKQYQIILDENRIGELKTFFERYVKGCPNNQLNTVANVNGLNTMKWQNDEFREGFTPSHTGPCEAWIDDIKVFSDNDCAVRYKAYPAELPIDYSLCIQQSCLFSFYWIGLHEPNWQLYKSCTMVQGVANNGPKPIQIIVDSKIYQCSSV